MTFCLTLTACGGGGGSSEDAAAASAADPAATALTVVVNAAPAGARPAPSDAIALAKVPAEADADAAAAANELAAEAEAATQAEAASGGASSSSEAVPPDTHSYRPSSSSSTLATKQDASSASDLTVRARGTPAGGVPPQMTVRVNGVVVGTASVAATQYTDYSFALPALPAGSSVDVVFTNDAVIDGEDRNLYVAYLSQGLQAVIPTAGNSVIDRGAKDRAFDGLDTLPGQSALYGNGALRIHWPAAAAPDPQWAAKTDAVRFLQQASFGATPADVQALLGKTYGTWLAEQMALPYQPDFVNAVQAKYALGDAYRPKGANFTIDWVGHKFWETAATSPDQLRKRVAFALHQIFMVSQADTNLRSHVRAYAAYYDLLNRHAFGNFRNLLEDMALSPAMGMYLTYIRNRKEDAATGRMPDENFAREIMQLFTIGLHELNPDGSLKRDTAGQPIETYSNQDVMALAKVFTGWSWGFPNSELTENNFRLVYLDYTVAGDRGVDLLPMKPYPGQHSTAAKTLFAGKPWATTIAANGTAQAGLRQALDTLFNHPNVGPFIGRQLIQRLVTSHPSNAYVARVAAVFANNGSGVRGDLGAVVRAVLLDAEARDPAHAGPGKLREPVLRVAQWMRALGARSVSGEYMMASILGNTGQRVLYAPSVFGDFRPGYVPPNTAFAALGQTAPEFQIVNESTVAAWINTAEAMAGNGLGRTGSTADVSVDHAALGALADSGDPQNLVDHLNLLLLGGRMSPTLRQGVLQAAGSVNPGAEATAHRARAATFLVLASPEYLSQP